MKRKRKVKRKKKKEEFEFIKYPMAIFVGKKLPLDVENINSVIQYSHRLFFSYANADETERDRILDEINSLIEEFNANAESKKVHWTKRKKYKDAVKILVGTRERMLRLR
jgi:hypothetical protein